MSSKADTPRVFFFTEEPENHVSWPETEMDLWQRDQPREFHKCRVGAGLNCSDSRAMRERGLI